MSPAAPAIAVDAIKIRGGRQRAVANPTVTLLLWRTGSARISVLRFTGQRLEEKLAAQTLARLDCSVLGLLLHNNNSNRLDCGFTIMLNVNALFTCSSGSLLIDIQPDNWMLIYADL